ncbi:MAG: hypothetical protein EHM48_10605, partial [Planctomycetaceae bacterium]
PDIHATGHVIDKIAAVRYHNIASVYNDSTTLGYLKTHAIAVSGESAKKPCKIFAGLIDSVADVQTLADTLNSERMCLATAKNTISPDYEIAISAAAIDAGVVLYSRPRNNALLSEIVAPDVTDRYTASEIETLLGNGVTPLKVNDDETVRISRMVTTYQTTDAWLDIATIDCMDYVRDVIVDMEENEFADAVIFDGFTDIVRARVIDKLLALQDLKIVRHVIENLDEVVVEEDANVPGRINVRVPTSVVPGAHVFANVFELRLF